MKRLLRIYGVFLVILLVVAVIAVKVSQLSGIPGALKKLGKGDREFLEARQSLVLGVADPSSALITFVNNTRHSDLARVQALRILGEVARHQEIPHGGSRIAPVLREASAELRLEALKAIEGTGDMEAAPALADLLASTADTAEFQQCFRTLTAGAVVVEKALKRGIDSDDTAVVDSCARILDSMPVGMGKTFPRLESYFLKRGDIPRATRYSRLALIRKWWVTGGWENQKMAAFYDTLPPERVAFSPADTWRLSDTSTARWMQVLHLSVPYGTPCVDIENMFVKKLYSVAYLITYLHVPSDRDALLFVGSDDGIRVWVNDSLMYSLKVFRGVFLDQDCMKIHLRKGANTLLVKVAQDIGGWALVCRVTDVHGRSMDDLSVSFTNVPEATDIRDIIALCAKGSPEWKKRAEALDESNEDVMDEVVGAVAAEDLPIESRVAASELLVELNQRRTVPAGEAVLLEQAKILAKHQAPAKLLKAVVQPLVTMNTAQGLDAGLAVRSSADPAVARLGGLLVSSYCKRRLAKVDVMRKNDGADAVSRLMNDLASLSSSDSRVRERLAQFYAQAGDTSRARTIAAAVQMPDKWLLRNRLSIGADGMPKGLSFSQAVFDAAWQSNGNVSQDWQKIRVKQDPTQGKGISVKLNGDNNFEGPPQHSCMVTVVNSDRADSAYLMLSFPVKALVVNGKNERPQWIVSSKRTSFDGDISESERELDVMACPVALKQGANTILIVCESYFVSRFAGSAFRCGFTDLGGNPVGCDGCTLSWNRRN